MERDKAIIKFNGGNLAMLCSNCYMIIKTGREFTPEEMEFALTKGKHLDPQYCEQCKSKKMKTEELRNKVIENYKVMIQAHEELNVISEEIIKKQKEHIAILEDHIGELRQIIEKYLLKIIPDDNDTN